MVCEGLNCECKRRILARQSRDQLFDTTNSALGLRDDLQWLADLTSFTPQKGAQCA